MRIAFGTTSAGVLAAAATILLVPGIGLAHCDGVDGPVVQAGRAALERGDVRPALAWIQAKNEQELRDAFATTLSVRKMNAEARQFADKYFFETLVRLHRAGEGAPYTGLKPAGRDLAPAIPAADKAIAEGSVQELMALLTGEMQRGIGRRFAEVRHTRDFDPADVPAGRAYVQAYVDFLHYVEGIYAASAGAAPHRDEGVHGEHQADPPR